MPPRSKTNPCRTVDPNGNLTTKTENGHLWTYTWNAENQLTRVTKDSAEVATFNYDPNGRRVEKVAGGVTYAYAYDGEHILRETRTGGTVFKYVHGPGIDEPLGREDQTAALNYYHVDGLGSVLKRSNQAASIVHEYRYDAWGNIEVGAGESGYAFTGREWDPTTGTYHYRARQYSATEGRFLAQDPIRFGGGMNFYAYVIDNPVRYRDPRGLDNPRCDFVPDWLEGPCLLECCKQHDACFAENSCSAGSSWPATLIPGGATSGRMGRCTACNREVVGCVVTACAFTPPTKPDCYDARTRTYIPCPPPDYARDIPPPNATKPSIPTRWTPSYTDPTTGKTYCYSPI